MEHLANLPLPFLVAGLLSWLCVFIWLVRRPEWIAGSVLAFFFFVPALLDLVLGGQHIPTGQTILFLFGPPLAVSLFFRRRPVGVFDVALLLGYGLVILASTLLNDIGFWKHKSALVPAFFALLIYLSVDNRPALYRVLRVYLLLILVNTLFQVLQRMGFAWAYLPSERHLAHAGGFARGVGLSGHFAMAGLYAVVLFPVGATLYVHARRLRQRVLAAVLGLTGLAGVMLAVLRAALLGAVLGTGYILWRSRSLKVSAALAGLALLMVVVVAVVPPLREAAGSLFEHTTTLDSSARARPRLAEMGLGAWRLSPFIGGGPSAVDRYVGRSADPHNTFVNVLAETGLVGLALFLALLWRCWRNTQRAIRRGYPREGTALAGALLATLPIAFFHSLNYIVLFWFVPALCLSLGRFPPLKHPGGTPRAKAGKEAGSAGP